MQQLRLPLPSQLPLLLPLPQLLLKKKEVLFSSLSLLLFLAALNLDVLPVVAAGLEPEGVAVADFDDFPLDRGSLAFLPRIGHSWHTASSSAPVAAGGQDDFSIVLPGDQTGDDEDEDAAAAAADSDKKDKSKSNRGKGNGEGEGDDTNDGGTGKKGNKQHLKHRDCEESRSTIKKKDNNNNNNKKKHRKGGRVPWDSTPEYVAPAPRDFFFIPLKFSAAALWLGGLVYALRSYKEREDSDGFYAFELKAQALAKQQFESMVERRTLSFRDPEMESRYIDVWRKLLARRIRGLSVCMMLYMVYIGLGLERHPQSERRRASAIRQIEVSPSWALIATSRSALTFDLACIVTVVMCIAMYVGTRQHKLIWSPKLDIVLSSWMVVLAFTGGTFMSKWVVCKLHGETPEDVFKSLGFDEEFIFGLIGLVLYLCLFTPMRFKIVAPLTIGIGVFYSVLVLTCVLDLYQTDDDDDDDDTEIKMQSKFNRMKRSSGNTALECCVMMGLVTGAALVGKYLNECDRRTSFLRMHQAYMLEQELQGEKEEGSTPITQARGALQKASQTLEVIQEAPGIAELIGKQVQTVRDRVRFAQRTLCRVDELFTVDADHIVADMSFVGDSDTKDFIKEAFLDAPKKDGYKSRGTKWRPSTRRRSVGAVSSMRSITSGRSGADPLQKEHVQNSVESTPAWKIASNFGTAWEFDALALARETGNCACLFAGERALVDGPSTINQDSQPRDVLGVGADVMRTWIRSVHCRYQPMAYHNEAHAAQVAHICVYLSHVSGWKNIANPVQITALVVAAFGHDVGHFARTNLFCAKTWNTISMLWNDRSVLENMHAAICFSLITGEADIFECLETEVRSKLRSMIVRFILATDIKEHHSFMSKFHAAISDPEFLLSPDENADDAALVRFEENVIMGGELLIKTADIAHSLLPWQMHREWSYRVNCEFLEQGDEEASLGLPLSPLCDRSNVKLASGQAFFIGHFGKGMMQEFSELVPKDSDMYAIVEKCLALGDANIDKWKTEEQMVDASKDTLEIILDRCGRPSVDRLYPYHFPKDEVLARVSTAQCLTEVSVMKPHRYID